MRYSRLAEPLAFPTVLDGRFHRYGPDGHLSRTTEPSDVELGPGRGPRVDLEVGRPGLVTDEHALA